MRAVSDNSMHGSPSPLALPQVDRELPLYLRTSAPVVFADGFYDEERHGLDAFRWMRESGRLAFAPADVPRFLEVWVLSEFHDLSQHLEVSCGPVRERIPLLTGWGRLSLPVPAGTDHVAFTVNRIFPREYYPDDSRTLSVRMRPPLLHEDTDRHTHIRRQYANAVANTREMLEGRTALASTPPSLGIDLYGVCNVKPPCVYCEWDFAKALEGRHVDTPFTLDTLREWGPFFDNSVSLVNCSIGEPFMMKNIDELLDAFGNAGKVLEMTTNGQILTDRNIRTLLGRPIDLYVSLDAGTPDTYAKLRNQRFSTILENLRRLVEAKGGPGALPHVHLVFMPMRVNVGELEQFVRIAADLRVDRLVLRPLNYSDGIALDWERGGYRFEYQRELLPFEELVRVSGRAAELCRRYGVELADQMDFGGDLGERFAELFQEGRQSVMVEPGGEATREATPTGGDESSTQTPDASAVVAGPAGAPVSPPSVTQSVESHDALAGPSFDGQLALADGHSAPIEVRPVAMPAEAARPSLGAERKPACTEPWRSLYILRRGVLPCCYGGAPIADMTEYRSAWNSPLLQDIRAELAAGRFHAYCLKSPACPIVRKSVQARALPVRQAVYVQLRRGWTRFDRMTRGGAGRLLHWSRLAVRGARRVLTDPEYRRRRFARRLPN
jgi:MoaA/NifB/PqqE/SkfB family radical SAM enzyme